VHQTDLSWLHIESSIALIYDKLVKLGFTYYEGKIVVIEPEEEKNYV
jgi:hypothetical protein